MATETQRYGLHETLEVHELLMFKTVCATKSATMQGLAEDAQLKQILQQDVQRSSNHIRDLQGILSTVQ